MNENVSVSTEKLRQRLLGDGVSEAVIRDSEQIMKNEFVALHSHLQQVKRKQMLLLDKLGQLETGKNRQTYSEVSLDKFRVFLGGSASGSDNKEEESDDEVDADNLFFDAKDFLSSISTRSTDSDDERSSFDSAKEFHPSEDGPSSGTRFAISDYPYVNRRKKLPEPLEKEKGVGLWSMIKDNIGKDLTKVCLPVFFNEPLSSLQRCFEEFEYSCLLDQAYEWGKMNRNAWITCNDRRQINNSVHLARHMKPIKTRKGSQVGVAVERGTARSRVHGVIHDRSGKSVATISGKWDESLHYSMGDSPSVDVGQDSDSKSHLLWKRSKPSNFKTKYNLTCFAITLNELSPELKQKLPPTDSRLRPDQWFLENGEYEMADSEKLRLEQIWCHLRLARLWVLSDICCNYQFSV
ncbi:hypothetical protein RND71_005595 [Anisodus tanguticus]|uniref:Uncharacterized protein n=1 Tax=Anisodus tanguticus TaxID=243964 RepID=A0AAE1VLM4_9SOLA|nr:hypothetical protein RND71_005595 [Anisodus tanguticus]